MKEFYEALCGELELLRDQTAYVDWNRLNGGDFFNVALEQALYESVCLIAIYQPNYFGTEHIYCAREYFAMQKLEDQRLALLPNAADRVHGLIIPVILRGEGAIPPEITNKREYEDFSRFMLVDEELAKNPHYAPKIKRIAEYVDARCKTIETAAVSFDNAANV